MIIVESHHEVLEHWAQYRRALPQAPRLLTLDHHTDTSAPFRSYLKKFPNHEAASLQKLWLEELDFKDSQSVLKAQKKLDHDEHIVTAIKTDIITSALVIAQNAMDTSAETYQQHRIMCLGVDRKRPSSSLDTEELDRVLESDFLQPLLQLFDRQLIEAQEPVLFQAPFILDIDLDYLNTKKSVSPADSQVLGELLQAAGLITIAVESEHVLLCSKEHGLTSSFLLNGIKKIIGEYL